MESGGSFFSATNKLYDKEQEVHQQQYQAPLLNNNEDVNSASSGYYSETELQQIQSSPSSPTASASAANADPYQQQQQQQHHNVMFHPSGGENNGMPGATTSFQPSSPNAINNNNNKSNNQFDGALTNAGVVATMTSIDGSFNNVIQLPNDMRINRKTGEVIFPISGGEKCCCGLITCNVDYTRVSAQHISSILFRRFKDMKAVWKGLLSLVIAVAGPVITAYVKKSVGLDDINVGRSSFDWMIPVSILSALTVLSQLRSIYDMCRTIWNVIGPSCAASYELTFTFVTGTTTESKREVRISSSCCMCDDEPITRIADQIAEQRVRMAINNFSTPVNNLITASASPVNPGRYYFRYEDAAQRGCCESKTFSVTSEYVRVESGSSSTTSKTSQHETVFLSDIGEIQVTKAAVNLNCTRLCAFMAFLFFVIAATLYAVPSSVPYTVNVDPYDGTETVEEGTDPKKVAQLALFGVGGLFTILAICMYIMARCAPQYDVQVFTRSDINENNAQSALTGFLVIAEPTITLRCENEGIATEVAATIRYAQVKRDLALKKGVFC